MTTFRPESTSDAAEIIGSAAEDSRPLWFVGSGSVPTMDGRTVLSSEKVNRIVDWQVDDLTVVVEAGVRVGDLEAELSTRNQTSLLPIGSPDRTVGGIVAEGASGYPRLRYGPTSDRVLEVTMATGYGRVVRGGGRLVKNVTGYDIPRLATGSLGSLGWIGQICLKLWPLSPARRVVSIDDPERTLANVYRPTAVLETEAGSIAVLEGTPSDVEHQLVVAGASGDTTEPSPIAEPVCLSVRVPPRHLPDTVAKLITIGAHRFIAQHGVGMIEAGWKSLAQEDMHGLRQHVESLGGSVVVRAADVSWSDVDRWGSPPSTIAIQRNLKMLFDPAQVCNPGVLAGGL